MSDNAITVRNLRKTYGSNEAVRGIDFEVARGEVFGLLGPNGAGKTTTIEILEGLRQRTSGEVSILGFDPGVNVASVKDRIGAALQSTNLPDRITVREALVLFSNFYSRHVSIDGVIDRLQLREKQNAFYSQLSGGQKQRLALALALINDPDLLFLDEPTTGLDPQIRLEIHGLIQQLRQEKRTIVLTTHYIEEAERLCDRVAIIDQGQVKAMGKPREIQQQVLGSSFIEVLVRDPWPDLAVPELIAEKVVFSADRRALTVTSAQPTRSLIEVVKWIDRIGIEVQDIHIKRPTLEDVFIELTGKRLRE